MEKSVAGRVKSRLFIDPFVSSGHGQAASRVILSEARAGGLIVSQGTLRNNTDTVSPVSFLASLLLPTGTATTLKGGYTFHYLKPRRSQLDPRYSPYDIQVTADYSSVDPLDYYTASCEAVIRFYGGHTESLSVAEMMAACDAHRRISALPFFQHFQEWKMVREWLSKIRRNKMSQSARQLSANLFHVNSRLSQAMITVQSQCQSLECTPIMSLQSLENLQSFLQIQRANREQLIAINLAAFNQVLMHVVSETARGALADAVLQSNTNTAHATTADYKYAHQAAKRNVARYLLRFIRMVDYMVVETAHRWLQAEVDSLVARLKQPESDAIFNAYAVIVDDHVTFSPSDSEFLAAIVDGVVGDLSTCIPQNLCFLSPRTADIIDSQEIGENLLEVSSTDFAELLAHNMRWKRNVDLVRQLMQDHLRELQEHADQLSSTCSALQPSSVVESFDIGVDDALWLANYEQLMVKLRQNIEDINAMPDSVQVRSIRLNLTPLKQTLLPSPTQYLSRLQAKLPVDLFDRCTSLVHALSSLIDSLQSTPGTIEEYVVRLTHLSNAKSLMEHYDQAFAQMDHGFSLVKNQHCSIEPDCMTIYQRLTSHLYQIKDAMDLADQSKEHVLQRFASDLDRAIVAVQVESLECRDEAMNPRIFMLDSDRSEILDLMMKLSKRIDALSAQSDEYENYTAQFKLSTSKKASLEPIKLDIDSKTRMWNILVSWEEMERKWKEMSSFGVKIDEIIETARKCDADILILSKALPPNDIITYLSDSTSKFLLLADILACYQNPSMKQSHWDSLQPYIGKMAIARDKEGFIGKMLDLNVFQHSSLIEGKSKEASEEARLETIVNDMRNRYFDLHVPLTAHQHQKDAFLVGDLDSVMANLHSDIVTLESLKTSPRFEHVSDPLSACEKTLQSFGSTLKELKEFQKSWETLEAIFNVATNRKELPDAARTFTRIDRQWKDTMRRIAKDPLISKIIEAKIVESLLVETSQLMQTCLQASSSLIGQM